MNGDDETNEAKVKRDEFHLKLSLDELYRIVLGVWGAEVELLRNPCFAVRNRSRAYGRLRVKLDTYYFKFADYGPDAVFDVTFSVDAIDGNASTTKPERPSTEHGEPTGA